MKFTFPSKSIYTLGLMAAFSVAIGSAIQQAVQAQTEPRTLEEVVMQWRAEDIARWENCDVVYQQEAELFEGNYFFDQFRKLNLTEEQKNASLTFNAQQEAETLEVLNSAVSVADPMAALSFMYTANIEEVPQDIQTAIQEALDNPDPDQEALNQKFGEYGEFQGGYIPYFTPEQKAQMEQISKDFEANMESVMTPEQVLQYRENLVAGDRIAEACNSEHLYAVYPAFGRVVDEIPELLQ
jgi:hypothetical protein